MKRKSAPVERVRYVALQAMSYTFRPDITRPGEEPDISRMTPDVIELLIAKGVMKRVVDVVAPEPAPEPEQPDDTPAPTTDEEN